MADHAEVEYATAQGNDLPAHVAMYDRFVHWIVVGGAHVANIVLGLAIGGVAGHWLLAFAIFVVATIVAFHGFLSGAKCCRCTKLIRAGFLTLICSARASALKSLSSSATTSSCSSVTTQRGSRPSQPAALHNPPMQWTEPAGKLLVVREQARRRLGH